MPNLILLKCFIYNGCVYLLLINFFYRQVNYLSGYQKKLLFIILSKKCFDYIFVFASRFFVEKILMYIQSRWGLFNFLILYYSNQLETDILLTKNQFYFIH